MKSSRYGVLPLAAFLIATAANAEPVPPAPKAIAPDEFLLIESELAHLSAADRPITLEAVGIAPSKVLEEFGKKSGLVIEVLGSLPSGVVLSPSFRDAKAGAALKWFAEQVPVQFRAKPPNTLEVFVEPRKAAPKGSTS